MSLYVIADLHLSTLAATNKSMEIFGPRWSGYMQRLADNWSRLVAPTDTVVVPGDISWALSLEEAVSDLSFLDALPGKKILGKGNHDFWWSTMKKHGELFERHGITTLSFLFNNAIETEDFILAGTRGWYQDEEMAAARDTADFQKLIHREGLRLATSLQAARRLQADAPDKEILAFLHFPPYWCGRYAGDLTAQLAEAGVRRVFYGHIHGKYAIPPTIEQDGLSLSIVSADYLNFVPLHIPRSDFSPFPAKSGQIS